MSEMELPGHGSLRTLARSMEVRTGKAPGGGSAEYLVFEVGP
jgi:hypothetical protein